jgi:hypothetical protein
VGEHAGVFDSVIARGRDAGGEAAEERERVHVDSDGAVGEGALEGDAHEAVGARLDALLREGRPQHVTKERLAADNVERAGAGRGVEGEAVERGA